MGFCSEDKDAFSTPRDHVSKNSDFCLDVGINTFQKNGYVGDLAFPPLNFSIRGNGKGQNHARIYGKNFRWAFYDTTGFRLYTEAFGGAIDRTIKISTGENDAVLLFMRTLFT